MNVILNMVPANIVTAFGSNTAVLTDEQLTDQIKNTESLFRPLRGDVLEKKVVDGIPNRLFSRSGAENLIFQWNWRQ